MLLFLQTRVLISRSLVADSMCDAGSEVGVATVVIEQACRAWQDVHQS